MERTSQDDSLPRTLELAPTLFVRLAVDMLFSSADIIIYQAEVLQIHCTTTIRLDVLFEHNHYSELVQKEIQNDLLLTEPEYLTVSLPSANCMKL